MRKVKEPKLIKQDWQILEELVANIQKQLSPDAIVEHNVLVKGVITGGNRQVDVLVSQQIGQYRIIIAIDCKDTKRPVDTKGVGEFSELIRDIQANKGVLVCPAGFTKNALKTAKSYQIDLYRPVDTGRHKWKISASFPALCDFRSAKLSIGFEGQTPFPFTFQTHPAYLPVLDSDNNDLGSAISIARSKWNSGKFPLELGVHTKCPIFDEPQTFVDNSQGTPIPVTFSATYQVEQTLYFGQIPINQISGFLDEHTGLVVTNSFTLGLLSPEEVKQKWKKLSPNEEPPTAPVFTILGLNLFDSPS